MAKFKKIPDTVNFASITFFFDEDFQLVCNVDDLPEDIKKQLLLRGIADKVGDSFAKNTGVIDAYDKAKALWECLMSGQYNQKRGVTGGRIIAAICNVTGKEPGEVMAKWEKMDDKAKALLRNDPKVKAELARLELEAVKDAKPTVDVVAMFD